MLSFEGIFFKYHYHLEQIPKFAYKNMQSIFQELIVITIDDLSRIIEVVKIKKICEDCGINYSTIMAKIQRKTELTIKESESITTVLEAYGLKFGYPTTNDKEKNKTQQYEDK